ncbi:hypothetical protein TYRP_016513 [Tyrophagus putrescentiae]|nr:hypothetical protein TYRP_016513 [Tyrophagus putrescentiae]
MASSRTTTPSIATDDHTPLRHRSTVQVRRTIGESAILRSLLQPAAVTPHRPRWHQPQPYSRELLAILCAVTAVDLPSLPLGRCILSSSSGGSPKTAPKLLRSISAVTALLASQIDTSLA